MGNVADDETRVILRKLAWFVPSFYVLFYSVATLYLAALGVSFDHLGAAPFLFDDDDFKPLLREAGQADRQLPLGAPRSPHPPFNTRRIALTRVRTLAREATKVASFRERVPDQASGAAHAASVCPEL